MLCFYNGLHTAYVLDTALGISFTLLLVHFLLSIFSHRAQHQVNWDSAIMFFVVDLKLIAPYIYNVTLIVHLSPFSEDPNLTAFQVVRDVLYSSRENVNFIHEIYRQAFLLNFTMSAAIRRAISVYKDWIQMNVSTK